MRMIDNGEIAKCACDKLQNAHNGRIAKCAHSYPGEIAARMLNIRLFVLGVLRDGSRAHVLSRSEDLRQRN